MPSDERVLVIPAAHFERIGSFTGFRTASEMPGQTLLDPGQFQFRTRSEVENDPRFKQLIPYMILLCGDQLFHYQRGAAGTETRLHALRSIGLGGHISEADAQGNDNPYRNGMLRELTEEVTVQCHYQEQFLGLIYDPRTLVGSVHLGIVHLLTLEQPAVVVNEEGIANPGFQAIDTLCQQKESFESWSQFVLEYLQGIIPDRGATTPPPSENRRPCPG